MDQFIGKKKKERKGTAWIVSASLRAELLGELRVAGKCAWLRGWHIINGIIGYYNLIHSKNDSNGPV